MEFGNGTLGLTLEAPADSVPHIAAGTWSESGALLFEQASPVPSLADWWPAGLLPVGADGRVTGREVAADGWVRQDDALFLRAEAARALAGGLVATWVVELARQGTLFRLHVRLDNNSTESRSVQWFPLWSADWDLPAQSLTWWKPLSFQPVPLDLAKPRQVSLGSRLHSSDTQGSDDEPWSPANPYWQVDGPDASLYFGLEWCGGWRAELAAASRGIRFEVALPECETQLCLEAGESMAGPTMAVCAAAGADQRSRRVAWMAQRAVLGRALYNAPEPSFPFAYNHWYTTRFDLSAEFLERQVAAMAPYDFDYFVIDAGWYAGCGDWTPDADKFGEAEFEGILARARATGARTGIWTCPQFVRDPDDAGPVGVDEPGYYEGFIKGHLRDLAGGGFGAYLGGHVAELRRRYGADWWKYDQVLFAAQTRQGAMRNVTAFHQALLDVRRAHPELFLENCQSGGRMTNEFTTLVAQAHWLRDGGDTGEGHCRGNWSEALGALEFLPPWTAMRWTNNPDRNDPGDDEFTRRYCRSAMAGAWGLVADLSAIGDRQRAVILTEAAHYRRLNELKRDCRYDLVRAANGAPVAGAVFYDGAGTRAGILLLRWDGEGALDWSAPMDGLTAGSRYRVQDVDRGEQTVQSGAALRDRGLTIRFGPERTSALVFVEAVGAATGGKAG